MEIWLMIFVRVEKVPVSLSIVFVLMMSQRLFFAHFQLNKPKRFGQIYGMGRNRFKILGNIHRPNSHFKRTKRQFLRPDVPH